MKNIDPVSFIVILITFGVVSFLLSITVKSAISELPMTETRVKLLNNILHSFNSIISMYIGFKLNNKN